MTFPELFATPEYAKYRTLLEAEFEGRVSHLYRDSAPQGNATCGVGHMLPDLVAAKALPWFSAEGDPNAIESDWVAVMSAEKGRPASYYRPLTKCSLFSRDIDVLLDEDLATHYADMMARYPWLESAPVPALLALLDMHFNLRAPKLDEYPHMMAAVRSGQWKLAAASCGRLGIQAARNQWCAGQLAGCATQAMSYPPAVSLIPL